METAVGPRAWVLNLDAEYELANLTMPASKQADVAKFPRAKFPFLRPQDRIVGRDEVEPGLQGVAWCPTPRALAKLTDVRAHIPKAPSVDTLRHVNHRGFVEQLGWPLPNTTFAVRADDALDALRKPGRWCAKRPLSAAGHGKRFIDGGELSEPDVRWIEASLRRQASLLIEPRIEMQLEFSVHGYLEQGGACRFGRTLSQEDRKPISAQLSNEQQENVASQVARVAEALIGAGYFGPFGIDGYLGSLEGEAIFVPRSEINARYTMNYPIELVDGHS